MNNFKIILFVFSLCVFFTSCDDDDSDDFPVALDAGSLTGGPFDFAVDGVPDMVSGITLTDFDGNGDVQSYVITDDAGMILGLPPTLTALEGVNFDEAGEGSCYIYHLTYDEGLVGLAAGRSVQDLDGNFDLSNFVVTNREGLNAGVLSGGPFEFTVDGSPDMVNGIVLDDSMLNGSRQTFVITDDLNNILGLPPTLEALEGVDFDGAGPGVCLIWHLTYSEGLSGLDPGNNVSDITGLFALSNSLSVTRNPLNAGMLEGGPFMFTVDGITDNVTGITLEESMLNGSNQTFVVTDAELNILGLPPSLEALEGVNFDGAGVGLCLIWHLTYEDGISGLEPGSNAGDLDGFFALSNSISVYRNPNAGEISGGPFEFTVDGVPDMVSGISLDNSDATGSNSTWVITDDQDNILGLPPTLADVEGVDFDGAGPGVCFIWYMRYEEGVTGLMAGGNVSDIEGLYGLSNSISVTRNEP